MVEGVRQDEGADERRSEMVLVQDWLMGKGCYGYG